jgi:alkanesulfonate monooxygenase SsuD/methylene tetrahydromethanopterin reductase-like flavin-dependent oxidoreductase (luciferase family)
MEFGIFDHLDRNALPLTRYYEERLQLVEAYDRAGFYCYHIAEHHSTPLGMAPSPSVFLSAVAQRTKRLRFAPLVYLLPFYHPLRIVEEICMLDHLSGGRLEIGVGRGISPIETRFYGLDPKATPKMFEESYAIMLMGLAGGPVTFEGEYYNFKDVPMELAPVQKPHPPLWYGTHAPDSAARCARRGFNIVNLDGTEQALATAVGYRDAWREANGEKPMPKVGLCRWIVVAEDDETALRSARRAYEHWFRNFNYLFRLHGIAPTLGEKPANFEAARADGRGVAGSPETVAKILSEQFEGSAYNYCIGDFAWGDLTLDESQRSVELFSKHVMPVLRAQAAREPAAKGH